jgi:hypothetical protein
MLPSNICVPCQVWLEVRRSRSSNSCVVGGVVHLAMCCVLWGSHAIALLQRTCARASQLPDVGLPGFPQLGGEGLYLAAVLR